MPVARPAPEEEIEPGESYTYSVSVDNTTFFEENYHETEDLEFAGLDPGVYAFSISGWVGRNSEAPLTYVALFGLAGDAPPIEPTDDVDRVVRDGSTLDVYGSDHSEIPTLRATVTDEEPDYVFSPVEVRQSRDLRNTLAYLATDGVTDIRYHAPDSLSLVTDALLSAPGNPGTYGLAGYSFELR